MRKPHYAGLLALVGSGVFADNDDPKASFHEPLQASGPRPSCRADKATPGKASA